MTVEQKFDKKLNEVMTALQQETTSVEQGISKKSIYQLNAINNDLEQMNKIHNSKVFSPSFPRYIIDSWDYSDTLGMELMSLLEIYKKL
ncbi:MAG: hypothetical protein WAX04_11830 [Oscillospiraceae bacterium]